MSSDTDSSCDSCPPGERSSEARTTKKRKQKISQWGLTAKEKGRFSQRESFPLSLLVDSHASKRVSRRGKAREARRTLQPVKMEELEVSETEVITITQMYETVEDKVVTKSEAQKTTEAGESVMLEPPPKSDVIAEVDDEKAVMLEPPECKVTPEVEHAESVIVEPSKYVITAGVEGGQSVMLEPPDSEHTSDVESEETVKLESPESEYTSEVESEETVMLESPGSEHTSDFESEETVKFESPESEVTAGVQEGESVKLESPEDASEIENEDLTLELPKSEAKAEVEDRESMMIEPSPAGEQESMTSETSPIEDEEYVKVETLPVVYQEPLTLETSPIEYQESLILQSSPVEYQESLTLETSPVEYQESPTLEPSPIEYQESLTLELSPVEYQESVTLETAKSEVSAQVPVLPTSLKLFELSETDLVERLEALSKKSEKLLEEEENDVVDDAPISSRLTESSSVSIESVILTSPEPTFSEISETITPESVVLTPELVFSEFRLDTETANATSEKRFGVPTNAKVIGYLYEEPVEKTEAVEVREITDQTSVYQSDITEVSEPLVATRERVSYEIDSSSGSFSSTEPYVSAPGRASNPFELSCRKSYMHFRSGHGPFVHPSKFFPSKGFLSKEETIEEAEPDPSTSHLDETLVSEERPIEQERQEYVLVQYAAAAKSKQSIRVESTEALTKSTKSKTIIGKKSSEAVIDASKSKEFIRKQSSETVKVTNKLIEITRKKSSELVSGPSKSKEIIGKQSSETIKQESKSKETIKKKSSEPVKGPSKSKVIIWKKAPENVKVETKSNENIGKQSEPEKVVSKSKENIGKKSSETVQVVSKSRENIRKKSSEAVQGEASGGPAAMGIPPLTITITESKSGHSGKEQISEEAKPKQEEPKPEPPLETIMERSPSIVSSVEETGLPRTLVFLEAVGALPISYTKKIADLYGCEIIDIDELIDDCRRPDGLFFGEYGEIVRSYDESHCAVPEELRCHLVLSRMEQFPISTKLILKNYPGNGADMDLFLTYVKPIIILHAVFFLQLSSDRVVRRRRSLSVDRYGRPFDNTPEEHVRLLAAEFQGRTSPVVEYFRLYRLLRTIDGTQQAMMVMRDLRSYISELRIPAFSIMRRYEYIPPMFTRSGHAAIRARGRGRGNWVVIDRDGNPIEDPIFYEF